MNKAWLDGWWIRSRRSFQRLFTFGGPVLCAVLILTARPIQAQDPSIVVPFTTMPPFMHFDDDGNRTGFSVELARLISSEIGASITFRDVRDTQEFMAAQSSGETQMIAGIAERPPLDASNVFSHTVATDVLRPTVLAERADALESAPFKGLRIGIVPPAVGSNHPILKQNIAVSFETPKAALVDLWSDELDAILAPTPVVSMIARRARLDGRLAFIDPLLQETTRHVALHESRADLLPAVNAAIERMEADGRLQALRNRFELTPPAPVPDVLTVGITDLPPLSIIRENGSHTGFNVDVMNALAERAGLDIKYKVLTVPDWVKGPVANNVDVIASLVITPDRLADMDFSYPLLERPISVVLRADDPRDYAVVSDLVGLRAGVIPGSIFDIRAKQAGLDTVAFPSNGESFAALERQEIDVTLVARRAAEATMGAMNTSNSFRIIDLGTEKIETAFALRRGLGFVREQLNAVIPGYILSSEYTSLRATYFSEVEFWTRTRMLTALGFGGGTLLFLALAFSVQIIRTRAAAAAAIATVKRELETIFDSTTSGIMAFDAAGQVVRINNQARHFLGGLSTPVPFEWPNEVKFLDVEDMHPLDASADPIRRAIAGAELRFSTHLMNRPNAGESHRYVRLESSTLDNVDTDIRTVVVFDDVSDEERNRQVVERKGRLEALGQLTGGIAHDFNNHLTTLLTSIFLAGNAKDETGRNRHLKVAEGAVQRARSVTTRLTAFARRQPGLSVSTSVREVFRTFEELVRPMIESSFQLTFEAEDPDLMIFCELAQLESALLNLVLNSRDAILRSGKGSRITIKARAIGHKGVDGTQVASQDGPDQFVEVSVTDNGPGMSDEVLSRATDPFFTTKDTNSGTGLGLSMVYGFARQADGDLRIYSEEGIGTTVQLTLPRGTRDGARRTKPEADEIIMGNGEMILLAEDEPQILETTTTLLEELGYKVLSAANGKEAYDLLKFNPQIDLLLTDVVMPGEIGGFSLAEKAREINPVLPIIYFSGYTGYSALEMGQVKGQLLQKPAAPAQLTRAIKSALAELE